MGGKKKVNRKIEVANGLARFQKQEHEQERATPMVRFSQAGQAVKKTGHGILEEIDSVVDKISKGTEATIHNFGQSLKGPVTDIKQTVYDGLSEMGIIERSPLDRVWRQVEKTFKPILDSVGDLFGNNTRSSLDKTLSTMHRYMEQAGEKLASFISKCEPKLKKALQPLVNLWDKLTKICQQLWEKVTHTHKQHLQPQND